MKIFNLCKKCDNLLCNPLEHLNLAKRLDNLSLVLFIKIVNKKHLIFDIEIKLTAQETAEVFMDEKIKIKPGGIVV
ncbi:MAG: hypothetical protein IT451_10660 [Candidatus Brocadia sp.]|nr:hypothetical protein [Candidatus Brocadia sp.]